MTTSEPIFEALKRLQRVDVPPSDKEILRPAFAAMHGSQAIRIPDRLVARIRHLDATLPRS